MKAKWLSLVCVFGLLVIVACSAFGEVPRTISYQGRLTNDTGTPLDGTYSITFCLYDVAVGGTALWSETKSVSVSQGLLSTALGDTAAFPSTVKFDKQYYLGVRVSTGSEMAPRQPFQSSPYALALPGVTVTQNGNVGIGTTSPGRRLSVNGGIAIDKGAMSTGNLDYGIVFGGDGVNGEGIASNRSPGGANYVGLDLYTFFEPRISITNGGNVGIGTTSPGRRLSVKGGIAIDKGAMSTGNLDYGIVFGGDGVNGEGMASNRSPGGANYAGLDLYTFFQPRISITNGGNVGINNQNPGAKLDVNGDIKCSTLILTSSRRFKQDVKPIESPLDTIGKLQGVSYNWDEEHGGKQDMGLIAEDVAKVLPELVTMEADGKNAVGMDYSHLIALAIEGIKAQQKEIEALKAQNAALEAKVARLEGGR